MRIIPIRGLNLRCRGHVDGGVPVECEDDEAGELIAIGMASRAPEAPTPPAAPEPAAEPPPPAPVIETATTPAAPEAAVARPRRARK